jgi:hypothetical protein
MKILFAISDRPSAWLQASVVLNELRPHHQVKLAGYKSLYPHLKKIDYNLSSLKISSENIGKKYNITLTPCDHEVFKSYLKIIYDYSPDLIISDHEEYTLAAAHILKIKSWNVSPLNLIYHWFPVAMRYHYDFLLYYYKRQTLRYNRDFFWGDMNLTYSPLCHMKIPMDWRLNKITWVQPAMPSINYIDQPISILNTFQRPDLESYFDQVPGIYNQINPDPHKVIVSNKINFSTGESGYLYGMLLNKDRITDPEYRVHVVPNLNDIETVMNAVVIKNNQIGNDLGQIENMKEHSIKRIDFILNNNEKLPLNFKLAHAPHYRKRIGFSLLERVNYHESNFGHRKRSSSRSSELFS